MAKFTSIFNKNTEVDANLNNLFNSKSVNNALKKNQINEKSSKLTVQTEKNNIVIEPDIRDSIDRDKLDSSKDNTEDRTIFIGNLHNDVKKEDLLKTFKSYGKIESIRFRNVVPEDLTKSKKYAFITKQQHPNKKTINAFVRFKEIDAAKSAADQTNGMEYKGLHLRVDIANNSKVHDNRRSLFLGGLPFDINDEDIYEHFSSCGPIEYVRIIRDNKTGIGKGFGYVQFKTSDTIALGLKLNGTVLNERKIRVNRCVKKEKKKSQNENSKGSSSKDARSKTFKMKKSSSEQKFTTNKATQSFKKDEMKKRPKKIKKNHKKKSITTNKKNNIKLNLK